MFIVSVLQQQSGLTVAIPRRSGRRRESASRRQRCRSGRLVASTPAAPVWAAAHPPRT